VWLQIIEEVRPKLVLTTGTGGGIGDDFEVGDVVVSPVVHFDSQKWLKPAPFAQEVFKDGPPKTKLFAQAKKLFAANKGQLPQTNKRPPKIFVGKTPPTSVVTTDFFGFDTSNNRYHLQGEGDVSEMGDAVLGLVAQKMGKAAPPWLAVRNVSDPQISASVGDERAQAQIAAHIYKTYGRWSTVCSAIVCWALIAAE
jgi:nucleoside phosphorylase